ncbi:MAG: oxidoreductase, family [Acidobacteria bacterium]|nr:oxidoreductase, family [Acidobacteriota bacterium]
MERNRRERNSRLLITGGTGFLGSHIAARLLQDGFEITLLARPSPEATAEQRVQRIMDWHDIPADTRRRLHVVQGDLCHPGLVPDAATRCRLLAEVDEIIHCASETSFVERKRVQIEEVNLRGLERLLDFAASGRCAAFHYVSTAFVAGRRDGFCAEILSTAREFHNAYEETKCLAERLVWECCRREGILTVICRPSIVYGHSRTGRSLLFNAIYHPVRAAVFLRDVFLRDIRENRGERARAAGVGLDPGGTILHMPLRIQAEGPGIDLVPVDFFADAFAAIFATALEDGIFHLVNGRPTHVGEIAAFTARMFGLRGIEAMSAADLDGSPRSAIEAAFEQMVDVYRPYMSDRRIFAREKSGPIFARAGLECPSFTFEVFQRCMSYAVDVGWGKTSGQRW